MPKAKTATRIRFDVMYMVVAAVALFGGYNVLSSYADSRVEHTTKPGRYKLAKYQVAGGYKLDLVQGLTYCFTPFTPAVTSSLSLSEQGANMGCYTPSTTLVTTVTFGDPTPTTVIVTQAQAH